MKVKLITKRYSIIEEIVNPQSLIVGSYIGTLKISRREEKFGMLEITLEERKR